MTLETEIPELPKNKIEAPDEAAFHKRQVEIDNKIKDLIKDMGDQKDKFTDFLDQKKANRQGQNGPAISKDQKQKRSRLGELNK